MIFNNSSVDGADPKRRTKRSRLWVTVISMLVAGVVTVLAVFAIQNHEDHVLTAQIIQTETDLKTTGARIADIKVSRACQSFSTTSRRMSPWSSGLIANMRSRSSGHLDQSSASYFLGLFTDRPGRLSKRWPWTVNWGGAD
jgi:hypothetical protein